MSKYAPYSVARGSRRQRYRAPILVAVLLLRRSRRFLLPSLPRRGWGRLFGVRKPPSVPPEYRGEERTAVPFRSSTFGETVPAVLFVFSLFMFSLASSAAVAQRDDAGAQSPAEEQRLNIGVFRAGLKKRGLTELLDLHLQDFPPKDKVDALLLSREIRLAEYADASRGMERRRQALHDANAILGQLVDTYSEDPRRVDWQFALVRSLLYEEAEPLITRILYRGGRDSDRERLRPMTGQALASLGALIDHLDEEYERIDAMPVVQFERLEKTGYITRLDQLKPQVHYIRLWALFYDSLAYAVDDPHNAQRLNEVRDGISAMQEVIKTPHKQSRVQVQALALLGMTYRRLNKNRLAREALRSAVTTGERIDDPTERARIEWAMQLARIERARNERDHGRFDAALEAVAALEASIQEHDAGFGLRLIATMEKRKIYQAWSGAKRRGGSDVDAAVYGRLAWQTLLELAAAYPDRRDDIHTIMYEQLDPSTSPDRLDPFERCAMVVGLLFEANRNGDQAEALLRRAVRVGDDHLEKVRSESPELTGELLYNMAVAEYRLGRTQSAAKRFLNLSRFYPGAVMAPAAARLAVELAAQVYSAKATPPTEAGTLYAGALIYLLERYPNTEAARYWRFFYAQLLDRRGEYDTAAQQYALVDDEHENYIESLFLGLRALAQALSTHVAEGTIDELRSRHRIDKLFGDYRTFVAKASIRIDASRSAPQNVDRRHLMARARALVAEALVQPTVERYSAALDLLADFESSFPKEHELSARVWGVRLTAYQQLGRLNEAARAIPAYLAAEPANAAPTLQALFATVASDVRPASFGTLNDELQRKADLALMLAEHVHGWVLASTTSISDEKRRGVTIQLAEASLWAGRHQRAWELFAALYEDPIGRQDQRIVFGLAEALFRLERYHEALESFNTLASALAPSDVLRWRALLRDLQCRDALGHDPAGIIKVIEQQKYLFPQMGGPALAPLFDKLLHASQRRRDRG